MGNLLKQQIGGIEMGEKIYCKYCAELVDEDCIVCPHCGKQIAELKYSNQGQAPINIVNTNTNANTNDNTNVNTNVNGMGGMVEKVCNKWVAFFLCLLLGFFGAHKFYEGKIGMGFLYFFTAGLFTIGWIVDCIIILTKPPYYVTYLRPRGYRY
jgi:hypothetical protein